MENKDNTKPNQYVRCQNCSYVYESSEGKCPRCGALHTVNESETNEAVFNLND